jgi:hypothetical protein
VGLFLGLGLEKRFQDGPIAILAEGQYNLTEGGLIAALGNCGGTNLSLGLRYYIAD